LTVVLTVFKNNSFNSVYTLYIQVGCFCKVMRDNSENSVRVTVNNCLFI